MVITELENNVLVTRMLSFQSRLMLELSEVRKKELQEHIQECREEILRRMDEGKRKEGWISPKTF